MRFEVLSREDMNALSRELSRAGVMNSRLEVDDEEVFHQAVLRGTYRELLNSCNVPAVEESLERIRETYDEMMEGWEVGQDRSVEELFEESDLEKLVIVTALMEMGAVKEDSGGLKLVKKVPLDDVELELRFPLEEVYTEDEEMRCFKIVTEVSLVKRYYVKILEVDRDSRGLRDGREQGQRDVRGYSPLDDGRYHTGTCREVQTKGSPDRGHHGPGAA